MSKSKSALFIDITHPVVEEQLKPYLAKKFLTDNNIFADINLDPSMISFTKQVGLSPIIHNQKDICKSSNWFQRYDHFKFCGKNRF